MARQLFATKSIAELHELKADPTRPASGTCMEASISEGRGVVVTVLVQEGTLHVGDVISASENDEPGGAADRPWPRRSRRTTRWRSPRARERGPHTV